MKSTPLLLIAFAAASAAPASAAWTSITASDFEMAPPPAKGSPAYQQDFATLLSLQDSRTQEQCDMATAMNIPTLSALYAPSGILTSAELSSVAPFLNQVDAKVNAIATAFKKEYMRPRPYNEDPQIQPCAPKPSGAQAYPSDHATVGAVDACVLGLIFPDRAAKLTDWGQYVGQLRVISGVHHPSDVAAGQTLAASICSWLEEQGDFNAAVAKLRTGP